MRSLRLGGVAHVVLAVPVATRAGLGLAQGADQTVAPFIIEEGVTVSEAYDDFTQLTNDDGCSCSIHVGRGNARGFE